jgi:K+-sensing histidine kinase KdpD
LETDIIHQEINLLLGKIKDKSPAFDGAVNLPGSADNPVLQSLNELAIAWAEERRQAAELIEQQQEQISHLIAEVRTLTETNTRFLRTVSHDLRAPLGGIAMAAELLLEPDPDWAEEERNSFIRDIIDQCRQLVDLINSLNPRKTTPSA